MKKLLLPLFLCLSFLQVNIAQTLVDTIGFPPSTQLNSFWGITSINDKLYIGADGNGDIYEVSQTGDILNIITTPVDINFNHGMVTDGTSFWVAEDYTSGGASLYNLDLSGNLISSFQLPPVIGGNSSGVGGLAMDGTQIWYSVYFPDFDDYPFGYAYLIKPNETNHSDTIPLYGQQVYGMAVKGDTIFYVTDDLNGDEERIYAYSKSLADTLYSFPLLDEDGDSSPRGLHWDGNYLWLLAKRPGSSAFAFSMLYKYEIESPIPMYPEMNLSIDSIPFDTIPVTTQSSRNFTIYNTGDVALTINNITIDEAVFSFNSPALPIQIEAGDSSIIEVVFTPNIMQYFSGTLSINSNGQSNPNQEILLTGYGENLVGVQEQNLISNIKVFPNPVSNFLTVEIATKKPLILQIELVDILGKVSISLADHLSISKQQKFSFDLSHLTAGNYFLVIKNEAAVLKTIPVQIE